MARLDIEDSQPKIFDIEPGEIALCDYSKPPDISCRRVKTMGQVSDGYHTFDELYAHRIELFIALCRMLSWRLGAAIATGETVIDDFDYTWRSERHSDGSAIEGWFVLGIYRTNGTQITYHLPINRWGDCGFAETLPLAPAFDGHTSADVLERLKKL